ncbi:NUDIX hydrolase [Salininema proteolyticum]|uniref:NUDIX hydrolase n=1 Tax=Salininema proteolyticum TaxID=1607685 RepID=A0ABV8U2D1_9ACTN
MIPNEQVHRAVERYLGEHPGDKEYLRELTEAMGTGELLASRLRAEGHVTCGGIVVNEKREMLQILHGKFGRWFFPGGHTEPEDYTLLGAAAREVEEETGLSDVEPVGVEAEPVHIGMHRVSKCGGNEGAEPWHFDFRYLFRHRGEGDLSLQLEEVDDARWAPVGSHSNDILNERVEAALAR